MNVARSVMLRIKSGGITVVTTSLLFASFGNLPRNDWTAGTFSGRIVTHNPCIIRLRNSTRSFIFLRMSESIARWSLARCRSPSARSKFNLYLVSRLEVMIRPSSTGTRKNAQITSLIECSSLAHATTAFPISNSWVFAHPADWGGDCGGGVFDGELARIDAGYVASGSGRSSRVKRMD